MKVVLLLAFVAAGLNLADLLTTYLGLNIGLTESDPTAANIIASGTFVSFAAVKITYSVGIVLMGVLFQLREAHYSKPVKSAGIIVFLVLIAYFGWTVIQNIALLG